MAHRKIPRSKDVNLNNLAKNTCIFFMRLFMQQKIFLQEIKKRDQRVSLRNYFKRMK